MGLETLEQPTSAITAVYSHVSLGELVRGGKPDPGGLTGVACAVGGSEAVAPELLRDIGARFCLAAGDPRTGLPGAFDTVLAETFADTDRPQLSIAAARLGPQHIQAYVFGHAQVSIETEPFGVGRRAVTLVAPPPYARGEGSPWQLASSLGPYLRSRRDFQLAAQRLLAAFGDADAAAFFAATTVDSEAGVPLDDRVFTHGGVAAWNRAPVRGLSLRLAGVGGPRALYSDREFAIRVEEEAVGVDGGGLPAVATR